MGKFGQCLTELSARCTVMAGNYSFYVFIPMVKMNANYAEICRVGNLEADFQQVLLVHFF